MGFSFNDLLNGILWGTVLSVGLSLVGGFVTKGVFNAFPEVKQRVVSDLPPNAVQDLRSKGLIE